MRYVVLVFFLVLSCNRFDAKKTTTETILKEELQAFNWNEVDVYPTFVSCRDETSKAIKKNCFESVLSNHILNSLKKREIVVSETLHDTILIHFKISEIGKLSIIAMATQERVTQQIPEIDNYIRESVKSIPVILPAIKRGQQVKTQFKLPVVIKVN